jgi:hypothetical protein
VRGAEVGRVVGEKAREERAREALEEHTADGCRFPGDGERAGGVARGHRGGGRNRRGRDGSTRRRGGHLDHGRAIGEGPREGKWRRRIQPGRAVE